MPNEVMARVEAGDWEVAMAERERIDHARHFTETYAYQCGIVAVDELVELYARYYPDVCTREEFRRFLFEDGPDPITRFDYWTFRGMRHLVYYELVDEREVIGGFADINGDRTVRPMRWSCSVVISSAATHMWISGVGPRQKRCSYRGLLLRG